MFHKHKWELVNKEFIEGTESEMSLERGTARSFEMMLQCYQGYYSYVFKCPCGEVKVTRS